MHEPVRDATCPVLSPNRACAHDERENDPKYSQTICFRLCRSSLQSFLLGKINKEKKELDDVTRNALTLLRRSEKFERFSHFESDRSSLPFFPFDIFITRFRSRIFKQQSGNLNCRVFELSSQPCETPASFSVREMFERETILCKYFTFCHFFAVEQAATCPNVLSGNNFERKGQGTCCGPV